MFKFAVIGISHPHVQTLEKSFSAYSSECVCVGFADAYPSDRQSFDKKLRENFPQGKNLTRYGDFHELIALKPDFAIVCPDNAACADVACELLENGIGVILEKPMCDGIKSAERILDAFAKAPEKDGKKPLFVVNWPIAWFPAFNKVKALCDEGRAGKILRVVYRSPATWGPFSYSADKINPPDEELAKTWWYTPERGGGSVLDYAGYGSALARWIFGKPAVDARGIKKRFCLGESINVEDYSAAILDFGDGVGLLEGSWSTFNPGEIPTGPVVYGDKAVIVADRHSNIVKVYEGRSHTPTEPTEIFELPRTIAEMNCGRNVLDHLENGSALHPLLDPKLNLDIMRILDKIRTDG